MLIKELMITIENCSEHHFLVDSLRIFANDNTNVIPVINMENQLMGIITKKIIQAIMV